MNKILCSPHILQSIVGIIVLLVGLIGWWFGKDTTGLIPLLGAVIGYTELKKFGETKKTLNDVTSNKDSNE